MAAKLIIAIDLGGTNLKIALLDEKYHIRYKDVLNTRRFSTKEKLISAIVTSIDAVIKNNNLKKTNILGVGLGLPGPIDHRRGLVHFFPNIPGWKEIDLKSILGKKLGVPVWIDNDAKLMTLAEYKLGSAKGMKNAFCLTLGTGVGGGLILQGKLFRGKDNASSEIGHLPINETGPACNCGGKACLESYVGNNRILRQAKTIFHRGITLEELSLLANKGNKKAKRIWLEAGGHLGVALSGVINLLNLDAVVIGGGVANAGKILFASIRQTIKERAMRVQGGRVKILKAKLGNDAGLIGAAIMVREGL